MILQDFEALRKKKPRAKKERRGQKWGKNGWGEIKGERKRKGWLHE